MGVAFPVIRSSTLNEWNKFRDFISRRGLTVTELRSGADQTAVLTMFKVCVEAHGLRLHSLAPIVVPLDIQLHERQRVKYDVSLKHMSRAVGTKHLSCPSAVILADSVFRATRQEEAMLTAVHQRVAKTRQIHPHHVHMERALWLLTGMGWQGGMKSVHVKSESDRQETVGRKDNKMIGCTFLTYALRLCSAPRQIRVAGPRGRALNQVTRLALK
ncbi:hypothetical protein EYF80_017447 [Liparis tanakae]|uniref:Uncharacterized protein n=1 Tax=Liparis tanakae TaxID=230148 RepID=A0A4Z2I4B6_9TELE|nr:hypothetical protein EYF80_017447 [Liparis tanakae]